MRWWRNDAVWRRVVLGLCAGLMAACGGGGGGGGSKGTTPVSATFAPPALSVTTIEGFEATATFVATVDPGGRDSLFLGAAEANGLVADGDVNVGGTSVFVTLRLSSALPPGVYTSAVQLLACADALCAQQLPGSPFLLPLRYEVLEQIKIQAPDTMRRVGREPAPVQSLPVVLPGQAGTISVELQGNGDAFAVQLQGDRLVVQTRQLPSGVYTARVQLAGSADSRYRAGVDLRYEVAPPPGGERPLTVTPARFDLRVAQGTQVTYRFKVDRPTWTDVLDPVSLWSADLGVVRNLRELGNDEYEFTVDTANLPPGAPPNSGQSGYFANVLVRAGDFGGLAGVSINVFVDAPVSLGSPDVGLLVNATTPAADLDRSTTVSAIDGSAVRWDARSDQPWLQVLRGTGTTGVDALAYRIDPSVLALDGLDHEARLTIALDRPGTLPVEVPIVVRNVIPRFDMASPGVLTGSSAKVYLHGQVRRDSEVLLAGVLSVDGATVQSIGIEEDSRFVGSVPLLAVTLGGITAGQPVTIRAASALRPASITLPSVAAVRVPVGYAALPFGSYRPASFASNGGALVFAGTNTVWRWPLAGSAWGALQRQDVAGVIDAAHAPDESVVYATVPNTVLALDPVTLVTRRQEFLRPTVDSAFDTAVAPLTSGFAFAADGRAFASVVAADPLQVSGHGVGWLTGCPGDFVFVADLTRMPCFADPGAPWLQDISVSVYGAAIVRSEDGSTIAMSYPAGRAEVYRGITRQRQDLARLPTGRSIVAVDNAGNVIVRDDGVLVQFGTFTSDLKSLLPTGFAAGGYAVRGDGNVVAVYAYRVANEPGGPRARDARVLLFGTPGTGNSALSGRVDLPDAVGSTALLVASETCEHAASLRFAPGNESLFVMGPRGVAAVPAPTLTAAMSSTRRGAFQRVVPATGPGAR